VDVPRPEDGPHASTAEDALDLVATGDDLADRRQPPVALRRRRLRPSRCHVIDQAEGILRDRVRAEAPADGQPPELEELLEPEDDPAPEPPDELEDDSPVEGGAAGGAGKPHFAYSVGPGLHAFAQSNANVMPLQLHEPWPHGPPFWAEHVHSIVLSPDAHSKVSIVMHDVVPSPSTPLEPPPIPE
jgi:hypothetical protein